MDQRPGIVTLRFTSRWPYNPISLAIATLTGSRFFSHVVAIIDDRAYEASMTHGCRACSVADVMKGIVRYQDMRVTVPDIDAARAFAEAQAGKPYDFAGALALPLLKSVQRAGVRAADGRRRHAAGSGRNAPRHPERPVPVLLPEDRNDARLIGVHAIQAATSGFFYAQQKGTHESNSTRCDELCRRHRLNRQRNHPHAVGRDRRHPDRAADSAAERLVHAAEERA